MIRWLRRKVRKRRGLSWLDDPSPDEHVIEESLPGKEWMIDECKFPREKEGVS